jgi:exodeoxyribonuclease I
MRSFLWHDYETFGSDPKSDRPAQFAAIRTSLELEPIGEPIEALCRVADDYLPHPEACALTGLTPRDTARGLIERDFAGLIHDAFAPPATIGVGYNSMRFDDEVTRHLLYRNLFDPYAREYANDNARWDLIDVVRMAYALRPAGLEWPQRDDASPSFKLQDLARANGVAQLSAHSALDDVRALIGLARRLKTAQPKLWAHALKLSDKRYARSLLDELSGAPVVHVSARFPARFGCLSLILPLNVHPTQPTALICADLRHDPSSWLRADVDELRERMYLSPRDLPDDAPRVALKLVRCNHAPMLAPLSVLRDVDHARIALDVEQAQRHAALLNAEPGLKDRASAAFSGNEPSAADDVDRALYSGFFSRQSRDELNRLRALPPTALAQAHVRSDDLRIPELLWRLRARNHPETLTAPERSRWDQERIQRIERSALPPAAFVDAIVSLRERGAAPPVLDRLSAWALEAHPNLFAAHPRLAQ